MSHILKNLAPPLNGARVAIVRRNSFSVRISLLEDRGSSYKTGDEITVSHYELEKQPTLTPNDGTSA